MIVFRHIVAALHDLISRPKLAPLPPRDVVHARLREAADRHRADTGETLDPIQSIVDRMKLLGLDHSPEARAVLWRELGLGAAGDYRMTAEQNGRLLAETDLQLARGDFADRI